VKEVKDGLDFFYTQRSHAIKMVEFLSAVVPIRSVSSEQLLSSDTKSNTANFKFTYSVEIIPICKDDLVCLPSKQARSLSNIVPLTICSRVGNSIHLLDPNTLQSVDLSSPVYWRTPFPSLATVSDLIEFTILDVEPSGITRGKYVLADAQVMPNNAMGSSDRGGQLGGMDIDTAGGTDSIYHTRTHLGGILQPGDTALGYFLTRSNFNSDDFDALDQSRVPDVILIKKTYPNRRKKNKARNWRLKSIVKEADENAGEGEIGRGAIGRRGGLDREKVERDYELFLRDLEEDEEMRGTVNLYKASGKGSKQGGKKKPQYAMDVEETPHVSEKIEEDAGEEEVDFPEIKMDELLEDFDELAIGEKGDENEEMSI
jgi:nonsense-mediated mRNA decay protein 3